MTSPRIMLLLPVLALVALSCGGGGGGGGGDDDPPRFKVVETRPVDGQKFVGQDAVPSVTFSQRVDPSTLGGRVMLHDTSGPVDGILLLDAGDKTVRFDPSDRLEISTTYTLALGGTIASFDGETLGDAESFSFHTVTRPTPRPPEARDFFRTFTNLSFGRSQHTATLLEDGQVLLAGGFSTAFQTTSRAEIYDPEAFSFGNTAGQLSNARARHTATRLKDGRVLITGGLASGGTVALDTCEIYDPEDDVFRTTGSLVHTRAHHTADLLDDGRVLVIGGEYYDAQANYVLRDTAEIYDPTTGDWSEIQNLMIRPRSVHTTTRLEDGRILVVGGGSDKAAEVFDPESSDFTRTTGDTKVWRWGHNAFRLDNGLVLISGGGDARGELYQPDSDTFDHATNGLSFNRYFATATAMRDGGILHLGGTLFEDPILFLASMDIYSQVQNPYGSYFQVFHVLVDPRTGHTATVLDDGSTLIAGGMNVDPLEPELNTALIFRQRD